MTASGVDRGTRPSRHLLQPGYRPDVDGLRAIAVLAVLGYHAFPSAVSGGFVGVDVFFVISGFLITSIILGSVERDAFTFREFYARRVRRIFPALIAVLLASMAIGWWVLVPGDYATLGAHVLGGAGFVSNVVLWREADYFDAAAQSKPLLHLWSLGIEEQFYLLWPPLLLIARRLRIDTLRLTAAVAIGSFALSLWLLRDHPSAAFYLPFARIWELLLGGALAHRALGGAHGVVHRGLADAAALLGLALIVAAVFTFDDGVAFPGWRALLPTLGTALLIAAGPQTLVGRRLLSLRALVAIGLISYPLYLWHWPLLAFARIDSGTEIAPWLRWALLGASAMLAWATWRVVERPFRGGRLQRHSVPILTLAMLATAGLGALLLAAHGVESRAGEPVRRYANYSYPFREASREGVCSLIAPDDPVVFPEVCTDPVDADGRPLVVVWGDSHAAMFYPGLRAIAGERFRIAQYTRSGCRPFAVAASDLCRRSNAAVLERLARQPPDTVLLFALWNNRRFRSGDDTLQQLDVTIAELRRIGVPRIVVMGPAPRWQGTLPADLIRLYAQRPFLRVPARMRNGLDPAPIALDAFLQDRLGARTDVTYFSVLRTLCDARGCLTHIGGDPDALTTWDYGHLTRPAAQYVAERLAPAVDDFASVERGNARAAD